MQEEFYSNWINNLPSDKGYLGRVQEKAKLLLHKLGLPNKAMEEWRLTNLKRMERLYTIPIKYKQKEITDELYKNQNENLIRLEINSDHYIHPKIFPNNVEEIKEPLLKEYFKSELEKDIKSDELQKKINQSMKSTIIALKVKANKSASIETIVDNSNNSLIPSRIIIIVEKNASLELLQIFKGEKESGISSLVDIYLENNSNVNHHLVAIGKDLSKLFATISVRQNKHSNYILNCFQEGWYLSRIEQQIEQANGNAETKILSLQISEKDQQIATHSIVKFNGPNGSLDQINKAIAKDNSHSIFHGAIEVPQVAQKTNASQLSKNLQLSEKARINTSPTLHIVADDVKCNHGATISQLEEEEIFYMQSRGIDSKNANVILTKGFCQDILNSLPSKIKEWSHLSKYINN